MPVTSTGMTTAGKEVDPRDIDVIAPNFKRRLSGVRFVWVMGADNLVGFHRWQHWRDIADLVPIAVVDRPGWRHAALASPAARAFARSRIPEGRAALLPGMKPPAWTFLTTRLSAASSTAMRGRGEG